MCITRLLFFYFLFFLSRPVRNIEQPVGIPPDGPGSVVPPSSVPRPGQPAHSPGDAAGRTRRTEDRRVGQVRPLGRKSRHTHTRTLSGEERWGHSLLKFIPNFLFSSEESCWADRNETLGRENAFRCVSLRDLPSVLLSGGGMVEEGWCVGIKMAGGEVFVRAETPPPCLWNPNNGERVRGLERCARSTSPGGTNDKTFSIWFHKKFNIRGNWTWDVFLMLHWDFSHDVTAAGFILQTLQVSIWIKINFISYFHFNLHKTGQVFFCPLKEQFTQNINSATMVESQGKFHRTQNISGASQTSCMKTCYVLLFGCFFILNKVSVYATTVLWTMKVYLEEVMTGFSFLGEVFL